jgi:hypothetical protein
MKTVNASVSFNSKASRLELFVRIVWGFVAAIVLGIYSVIGTALWIIQILHILVISRRHKGIHAFIKTVVIARYRLQAYILLLTDERPPIIPEWMKA